MTARIFDTTLCSLGEGPLWHPTRQSLFWFDINGYRMYEKRDGHLASWQFDTFVSAAGWVDDTHLLIAKKGALISFDLVSGAERVLHALEDDNPITRPNDGRADPWGGFWIGTMGINLEPKVGTIYRYYKGELRPLFTEWTIPNSTCFSPCGSFAYFTDTPVGKIWRQKLDGDGWPDGEPEAFVDLSKGDYCPDGAVVDSRGHIWIAHYGYSKVTEFSAEGDALQVVHTPASQTTCPAFGGVDLSTLYVTSARQQLDAPADADGQVIEVSLDVRGQQEHQVIL